jgi:hypothetical protein
MSKTIRILLIATFVVLGIASCSSPAVEATPVPPTSTPTNTPWPPQNTPTPPQPTATKIQLPFVNGPIDDVDYCGESLSSVLLPLADAQGLSEDEIAAKLMDLWLAYFNAPQAPGYCRIDGYHIGSVCYNALTMPYRPKADFVRSVKFSIKLIQLPNYWMGNFGLIDEQNWLRTEKNVAVFRSDSGYTMEFAAP